MRNIVSFSLSSLPTILRHRERCDHRRGISRKKETFRRHHEKSSSRATAWKIYFSSPINLHVFFPRKRRKGCWKRKTFSLLGSGVCQQNSSPPWGEKWSEKCLHKSSFSSLVCVVNMWRRHDMADRVSTSMWAKRKERSKFAWFNRN